MPESSPSPDLDDASLDRAYRAPVEQAAPRSDAVSGAGLVLADIALAPIAVQVLAFALSFARVELPIALRAPSFLAAAGAVLSVVGTLRIVRSAPAARLGVSLRVALAGAAITRALVLAVGALLALAARGTLLRTGGAFAFVVRETIVVPTFMILLVVASGQLLAGERRWLVRVAAVAVLADVTLRFLQQVGPFLFGTASLDAMRFEDAVGAASLVTALGSWVAASLLVRRVRAHLREEPPARARRAGAR